MTPSTLRLFRKLHRWFGLALAGLICCYCVTGLLHRPADNLFSVLQSDPQFH